MVHPPLSLASNQLDPQFGLDTRLRLGVMPCLQTWFEVNNVDHKILEDDPYYQILGQLVEDFRCQ